MRDRLRQYPEDHIQQAASLAIESPDMYDVDADVRPMLDFLAREGRRLLARGESIEFAEHPAPQVVECAHLRELVEECEREAEG
ncbi:MAG: hypothetical protein AAF682_19555 [Planctomycetota bacterium]